MERIIVVEDEADIARLVTVSLERSGHEVTSYQDGAVGLHAILSEQPDLVILDLMLPSMDGFQILKEMQRDSRTSSIPVLMLTARGEIEDRIRGLEAGADDYLTKPFSPKELNLRVQAVLRRNASTPGTVVYTFGPFRFDKNNLTFHLYDEQVDLTSTEFKLLLYLCERHTRTQERSDLLRAVWGYSDDVHSRTLDTHMKRLRQKLGDSSNYVETVRGVGYRVREVE